jgi:hypothetical protein
MASLIASDTEAVCYKLQNQKSFHEEHYQSQLDKMLQRNKKSPLV